MYKKSIVLVGLDHVISWDTDGGATEADGGASAPVGPSVATPLIGRHIQPEKGMIVVSLTNHTSSFFIIDIAALMKLSLKIYLNIVFSECSHSALFPLRILYNCCLG